MDAPPLGGVLVDDVTEDGVVMYDMDLVGVVEMQAQIPCSHMPLLVFDGCPCCPGVLLYVFGVLDRLCLLIYLLVLDMR